MEESDIATATKLHSFAEEEHDSSSDEVYSETGCYSSLEDANDISSVKLCLS